MVYISGAAGTVKKLISIVAQPCHLAEQIGVVRAWTGMDFFACNERAQVFFSRQTTHFNLFAKIAIFTLI